MKNTSLRGYIHKSNKSIRKYLGTTNTKFRIVAKSGWHREGQNQEGVTKGCINFTEMLDTRVLDSMTFIVCLYFLYILSTI